jgi:putative endonuclease
MNRGAVYEQGAVDLLEAAGLRVLERNFRCKLGEIDIICSRGQQLVFVEVRYRRNPRYASPAASVTAQKQRRLLRTAQWYLQQQGWSNTRPCRFDVVAITPSQSGREDEIQWLQNAFTM